MDLDKVLEECRNEVEKVGRVRGFPSDLSGVCTISSYRLFKRLKKAGISGEIIVMNFKNGSSHCWIESSGKVFDLTMTQFGREKIVKEKRQKYLKLLFSNKVVKVVEKSCFRFDCEKDFKKYLVESGWQKKQIP